MKRRSERGLTSAPSRELNVLYEDNHLLVVNKPADLATMGSASGQDSLHQQAMRYVKRKYNKPGNVYIGVVSRLDRLTSGVIVLARTSKSASRLTQQFADKSRQQDKTLEKTYLAWIAGGDDLPDEGQWQDEVYKDDQAHRMRVATSVERATKTAILHYHIEQRRRGRTLVRVHPITGRKHQIRLQFANRGYPILGDRKYNSDQPWPIGIALHSHRLGLIHPTLKKAMIFDAPVPNDWPS